MTSLKPLSIKQVIRWNQREVSLALLVILYAFGVGMLRPDFLSPVNLRDILTNSAYTAIAGVGMTLVILIGAIDISIGSMLAVCSISAGHLARMGMPMPLVVLATILIGGIMGAINGVGVAWGRIPPILMTLGMMGVLRGGILWRTEGIWIQNLPPAFLALGQGYWLGIPLPVWVMALVVGGFAWGMHTLPVGRICYAVGSNQTAAALAGIRLNRVTLAVFILQGILIGVAALTYATRFSAIQSNTGQGFELLVITAVVVGGTDILGGSGTVIGTLLGVLLLTMISTSLTFLGVPAFWEQATQGALILLVIIADHARKSRNRESTGHGGIGAIIER